MYIFRPIGTREAVYSTIIPSLMIRISTTFILTGILLTASASNSCMSSITIPQATERCCVSTCRISSGSIAPWKPGCTLPDGWVPTLTVLEAQYPCGIMSPTELSGTLKQFGVPMPDPLDELTLSWLTHFISSDLTFGSSYAWATSLVHHPTVFELEKGRGSAEKRPVTRYNRLLTEEEGEDKLFTIETGPDGLRVLRGSTWMRIGRRIWDLAGNRVVPSGWVPLAIWNRPILKFKAISHSWTHDMELTWSDVNAYQWPIPLPKGVTLEAIRQSLLSRDTKYCWLDVVCLRQAQCENAGYPEREYDGEDPFARLKITETKRNSAQLEEIRMQEWKVDVPTIGSIYRYTEMVVYYLNGLGRPLDKSLLKISDDINEDSYNEVHKIGLSSPSDRHWLNRAWVLQEILSPWDMILGSEIKPVSQMATFISTAV
ncbi:hypothetical protein BDZ91DRAFT_97348 [Kalaharituber pfeilii]|nr:hypothetical protein BDZ91DRAFT_97348 [Kalaharituber pfeilii]